jgi:NDP-sugar pyrophosphorylase family protein
MKQAIVLAAGEGQRLRPFTVTRSKAMLSIADKPILQFVIESLAQNGIRDVILVVGYRKEQMYDYLGSREQLGIDITYVTQETQLGTAHALLQVKDMTEDEFLVLPGDNLIEAHTIADFLEVEPQAVLVKRVSDPVRYGVVGMKGSEITDIIEKPKEAASNLVNTGIYVFTKDVFKFAESVLDIPDALNNMIAEGYTIQALETSGTWLDVVYPWDIISLNDAVLKNIDVSLGGTIESGATIKGKVMVKVRWYVPVPVSTGRRLSGRGVISGLMYVSCRLPVSAITSLSPRLRKSRTALSVMMSSSAPDVLSAIP